MTYEAAFIGGIFSGRRERVSPPPEGATRVSFVLLKGGSVHYRPIYICHLRGKMTLLYECPHEEAILN